jgi:RecG-like helicase
MSRAVWPEKSLAPLLEQRISTLLGRKEAVVCIHGSMGREERTTTQESFRHDPEVKVLLATDAAGEGINLQRGHLMVSEHSGCTQSTPEPSVKKSRASDRSSI